MSDELDRQIDRQRAELKKLDEKIAATKKELLERIADMWEKGITRENCLQQTKNLENKVLKVLREGKIRGKSLTSEESLVLEDAVRFCQENRELIYLITNKDYEQYLVEALMRRTKQRQIEQ